jgi:hypothetical protein
MNICDIRFIFPNIFQEKGWGCHPVRTASSSLTQALENMDRAKPDLGLTQLLLVRGFK